MSAAGGGIGLVKIKRFTSSPVNSPWTLFRELNGKHFNSNRAKALAPSKRLQPNSSHQVFRVTQH